MKRLLLLISILIAPSAWALDLCDTNSQGEVIKPLDRQGCSLRPTTYTTTVFSIHMCKTRPTPPTTADVPLDTSNCELLFENPQGSKQAIGLGQFTDLQGRYNRPSLGLYPFAVVVFDEAIDITNTIAFSTTNQKGQAGTTGKYCRTDTTTDGLICSATQGTATPVTRRIDELGDDTTNNIDGTTNRNNLSVGIVDTYVLKTDLTPAQIGDANSTVDKYAALVQLTTPLNNTESVVGLNLQFTTQQGAWIWNNNDGTNDVITIYQGDMSADVSLF